MVGPSPPPFFKRGPAPLAKLVFFVIVSLALLISDLNLRYLDAFRQGLSVLAYPLQMAAATPADFVRNASNYFSSLVRLQIENKELKSRQLQGAERLLRLDQLEQENRHLRALLEARERQPVKSVVAEIMYTAKDPFSRKVILDKGDQAGIAAGQAVVDESGVIGQITRVFPMQSELTLLTDKDQAIPVMIVRSGLRAVLFGSGNGLMELRYLAANATSSRATRSSPRASTASSWPGCRWPRWPRSSATRRRPSPASRACPPRGSSSSATCWCWDTGKTCRRGRRRPR